MSVDPSPLKDEFTLLVKGCFRTPSLQDGDIRAYVTELLTRFMHVATAHQVKIGDRTVDDIGEMAVEADPVFGHASSFEEERRIRQHVGDSALFFAGMYPESVHYRQRHQHRVQTTDDLIRVGRENYYIVSQFDVYEYRQQAPLFGKLSRRFEDLVGGVRRIRRELDDQKYLIRTP